MVSDINYEINATANYYYFLTDQFNDPNESRNPSLGNKILYMKPLFETKLKFLNRTMIPANSTTHSDYVWDPIPAPPPPVNNDLPLEIKVTPIVVDRSKPSYSKYLDPTATTNRLDYCYRSPQEIMSGIGAQDNITFWSWQKETHRPFKVVPEKDVQQCDKLPADSCVKRRAEYTSTLKHVPNSGMTTEVRENYLKPQTRMIDFNTTNIRNICVYQQVESSPKHTEYMLIGSGESTRKYI